MITNESAFLVIIRIIVAPAMKIATGSVNDYWGKKIIEWSRSHEEALSTMIHTHDRYALYGRDSNTYTNIPWCFGLYDCPWFERPVPVQVHYLSYDGMKRKTNVKAHVHEIRNL
jgi:deoxyribodipyrimidine photo-lyase